MLERNQKRSTEDHEKIHEPTSTKETTVRPSSANSRHESKTTMEKNVPIAKDIQICQENGVQTSKMRGHSPEQITKDTKKYANTMSQLGNGAKMRQRREQANQQLTEPPRAQQ